MTNFQIGLIVGAVIALIFIVLYRIKECRKKSKSDLMRSVDRYYIPSDALKDFEPIKSHIEKMDKAERMKEALYNAIQRNLVDNLYIPRPRYPWMQTSACRFELPDLLELQNVISLKPIIKELEDQYQRFEEARDTFNLEFDFTSNLILKVMNKLKDDQAFNDLASVRGVYNSECPNKSLYELIKSNEAKGIVERCIKESQVNLTTD